MIASCILSKIFPAIDDFSSTTISSDASVGQDVAPVYFLLVKTLTLAVDSCPAAILVKDAFLVELHAFSSCLPITCIADTIAVAVHMAVRLAGVIHGNLHSILDLHLLSRLVDLPSSNPDI